MRRRRSFIESKTSEVQTSNVGFTSEVSDYLVVHTGPGVIKGVGALAMTSQEQLNLNSACNFHRVLFHATEC